MRRDGDESQQELWYALLRSSQNPQQTASSVDSTLLQRLKVKPALLETVNVTAEVPVTPVHSTIDKI